jgi:hypothetical protein
MYIDKNSSRLLPVCKIFVVPVTDVNTFAEGSSRFRRTITLKTGKEWLEIYFTAGTAKYNEKEKEEDAGSLIEQTLKFSFPGEDSDTASLIASISLRQLIVLMSISGSTPKVFGSLENGARLKINRELSAKGSSTECEISCKSEYFAWWLQTGAPPD